jgi:hypothetical protein
MAGMILNWQDNPRYQRLVQRISAMRPDQRAILNTALVDEGFANDAVRKHLASLAMAADKKYQDRALSLENKQIDIRHSLAQQELDQENKQGRIGTALAAANIPISGYFGMKQMDRDKAQAEAERKWRTDFLSTLPALRGGV